MTVPTDFRKLERTFVIAEIGVNHEGDKDVAADLIRKAAKCGADAVKFQTYLAEEYVSTVQPERLERVKRFQLSFDDFADLAAVAKSEGVLFFSTPLDTESVDFLDTVAPIFKISSGDLTYTSLIQHVASKKKPMIVSTGLGTKEEIGDAIAAARAGNPEIVGKGQLLLMHCVAAYPTPMDEANLANIKWLRDEFGLPVGYSDHTLGTSACVLAIGAGAQALEKHFTYRKEDQTFHDHAVSADPTDLTELVSRVREAETYMGASVRTRGPMEVQGIAHMRRGVAAKVDIPADAVIEAEWLTGLRPAQAFQITEIDQVIGHRLNRAVSAGDLIRTEDIAG